MLTSQIQAFASSLRKIEWSYFVDTLAEDPQYLVFYSFFPVSSGLALDIGLEVNNDWYGHVGDKGGHLTGIRLSLSGTGLGVTSAAPFLLGTIRSITLTELYKDDGLPGLRSVHSATINLPTPIQASSFLAIFASSFGSGDSPSVELLLGSLGLDLSSLSFDESLAHWPDNSNPLYSSGSSTDESLSTVKSLAATRSNSNMSANPVADAIATIAGQALRERGGMADALNGTSLLVRSSTWSDSVRVNRIAKAVAFGETIYARQITTGDDPRVGSVLQGSDSNDVLRGMAGWDMLDGGAGNDLIRGGNGRDIITGGLGSDELHGDFGWNTFTSEIDGFADLIVVKSDQFLENWVYGKAGNNPNGEKCDIIEGLDPIDRIRIIGVGTEDLTFKENVTSKGVTGIGIYGGGALEALYIGGNLSIAQITAMTSGDVSPGAMENRIFSYGWTQSPGTFSPLLA